nr:MAG TPA: hypothetical protein [Caudoviricetes sp.]
MVIYNYLLALDQKKDPIKIAEECSAYLKHTVLNNNNFFDEITRTITWRNVWSEYYQEID